MHDVCRSGSQQPTSLSAASRSSLAERLARRPDTPPSDPPLLTVLVAFGPLLRACQPHSLPDSTATPVRHHNRAFTLVFGSDGQVSLLGFDGSIPSSTPTAIPVIVASRTGLPALPTSSQSVSPIPYRAATSVNSTSSGTPTAASASSSTNLNATDTDTNLPSVPTVNYPTPTPTAESSPRDHGVGAPFYLAIVLASLAFIACVSAVIAWWIRSRRRRRIELEDPYVNHNDLDVDSPIIIAHTDNTEMDKGDNAETQTSTSPYYIPASILPFPQRNMTEDRALQDGSRPAGLGLDAGPYPARLDNPHSLRAGSRRNVPSTQARPGAERSETRLSVQESARTLGRLRVANRVPGDVTSGDEGMTIRTRLQDRSRSSPNTEDAYGQRTGSSEENALQNLGVDEHGRRAEDDYPLEPPGPATVSWGQSIGDIAAFRRTRRPPEPEAQTSRNSPGPVLPPIKPSSPQGWTGTLKSTFWNAVDAVAGNRPSDLDPQSGNGGSGSRFTSAPQRVASRRSPTSPSRPERLGFGSSLSPITSDNGADASAATRSGVIYESPSSLPSEYFSHPGSRAPSTIPSNETPIGQARPLHVKVSNLNRPINDPGNKRRLESLRAESGSIYSTDSAAARANLRKYGYADSVSSRSGLGLLDRPSRSSTPVSLTPSRLMMELNLPYDSGSVLSPEEDSLRSEDGTIRSRSNATSSGGTMTGSMYGVSRNATRQSARSTIRSGRNTPSSASGTNSIHNVSRQSTRHSGRSFLASGSAPLQSSSTPTTLTRKNGVTRRRPQPLRRLSSTASSVQSTDSGQSIRETAVRKALLERRRRVGAAASHEGREDNLRSRDSAV